MPNIKINYSLNDSNVITSYTIIPFNESLPTLEISEEDLKKIKVGYTKLINGVLDFNTAKYQEVKYAKIELSEIKKWFFDNDWKVNKVVIGEWNKTDSRWLEYLEQRQIKRARQDELNSTLNNL